jgi:hypothetical protein
MRVVKDSCRVFGSVLLAVAFGLMLATDLDRGYLHD